MAKMSKEQMEEAQAQISEVITYVEGALEDLQNAESCETVEDFKANLKSAFDNLNTARIEAAQLSK